MCQISNTIFCQAALSAAMDSLEHCVEFPTRINPAKAIHGYNLVKGWEKEAKVAYLSMSETEKRPDIVKDRI